MKNDWKPTKRYLHQMAALYGDKKPLAPAKKIRSDCPTEEEDQIRLVNWCHDEGIRVYSIPNGRTTIGENMRCIRMGQSSGIPDLCFPYAKRGFGSLYIELKRVTRGVVSPAQREWIEWLNEHGQFARVAFGFDEAKKIVESYLND